MDGKSFLLGFIPPLLAFLAEFKNPVSAEVIRPKAEIHATQHVFRPADIKPGVAYDPQGAKQALVTTIVATGETAAEVAGIVPTWISITAATTAVFADLVPVWAFLLILLLVTGGSALLGIRYFQRIDYQSEAVVSAGKKSGICRRDREVDQISCWIKVGNLLVAAIVFIVWVATPGTLVSQLMEGDSTLSVMQAIEKRSTMLG